MIRLLCWEGYDSPRVLEPFERFGTRDLDAIQWDRLEEDVDRCADYDLMPDHAVLLPLLHRAVASRGAA